ncbi:MAG: c-type cytochrome biogenesis protein CcmI [Xanthobacteraceae bacterium]|jgi:cytochrome c-type biogenesis protein CcmH
MTLWIIFAVMTAVAIFAVVSPFGRKPSALRGGSDRFVYQDQLRELGRDRAAGLIGETEAESARVEISRRLLAAAEAETLASGPAPSAVRYRRVAALAAFVIVPVVAAGLYLRLGSPNIPDQSAFARHDASQTGQSVEQLVSQVEAHLAGNPNDGSGWQIIAPVYLRLGRFDDAIIAFRKAIALDGDSAPRESALGEALVGAANGVVTDEAKLAFQHAVDGDPQDAKARYFLGLADEQDGNRDAAAAKWRAMLDQAPRDAPWAGFVRSALARIEGGPVAADGAATTADDMSGPQRAAMIRSMVQRLADRLQTDGSDVAGWIRLVRAYVVLGDRGRAKDAAADARRALREHPDAIEQLDAVVKGLGLEG